MELKNSSIEKLNIIISEINTLDNEISDLISKTKSLLESSKDDGLIFDLDIKIPKKEEKDIFDENGSLKSKNYTNNYTFALGDRAMGKNSYLSYVLDNFMRLTNKIDDKNNSKSYELSNSDCIRILDIILVSKKKRRKELSQSLNELLKSLTK